VLKGDEIHLVGMASTGILRVSGDQMTGTLQCAGQSARVIARRQTDQTRHSRSPVNNNRFRHEGTIHSILSGKHAFRVMRARVLELTGYGSRRDAATLDANEFPRIALR
jgi:hypothetical protein